MRRFFKAVVTTVAAAAAVDALWLALPGPVGGVLKSFAAEQQPQGPRYRPGAGLIDQIRSDDVYRFGGARAPGRDWAFGWKDAISDPVLKTYEAKDFRPRAQLEKNATDLPTLYRPVDLVIGVNLSLTDPIKDSTHWRVPLLPGELFMHPSAVNQLPTARFLVPATGEYTITGFFQNIGCSGTINGVVSVVSDRQGKPVLRVLSENVSNAAEAPYKIIQDFNKGDLIDFSVDSAGNYSCDSTRLDAQIVPSVRVAPDARPDGSPSPGQVQKPGSGVVASPSPTQPSPAKPRPVPAKPKQRPAASGVLDVQVKWWLWPGNQSFPQAQPKAPTKPQPKPAPEVQPQPKPQPTAPVSQPVQPTPPPAGVIVQPPVPEPQPEIKPSPDPVPAPAPGPAPAPAQGAKPLPKPAVPAAQRAVDYSPLFARGVAKAAIGDKRGAIADFTQAIAVNPKFSAAFYSRGLAKLDLNDRAGACADFAAARQLGDAAAAAAERQSCP